MKITAIKAQVKNAERVSVYVDESYAFSLNHAQLLEQKLRVGLELDDARLAELKKVSDFGKAFERVLNYLSIRLRSEKEVRDYCWRKKYSPEDAEILVQKFKDRGCINDAAFAKAWVESRRLTKSYSQRRLQLELKQKGVREDIIKDVLDQSEYRETDALAELVAKKGKLARYRQDPQKFMQYLARQGFAYDDIKQALGQECSDQD